MKDAILAMVRIGLPLTVTASMFAQGMTIALNQLALFEQRPVLMLRSLVVVVVLVPLAVLVILMMLKPEPEVKIGLSILAASPAAPLMLVKIPKKGGSLAYMACLHLSLALLAILTVPVTLELFSRVFGFRLEVDVVAVARVVGMTILVPVCLGMMIRSLFPGIAGTVGPVLARICAVALMALILCVVGLTYGHLLKMNPGAYLVMAVAVAASIGIGHGLGPQDPHERTTLAIESAARHPGLAMTIAVLNFSPQTALPVLIPYLVVFVVISTMYLHWRKRLFPEPVLTIVPKNKHRADQSRTHQDAGGHGSATGSENEGIGR